MTFFKKKESLKDKLSKQNREKNIYEEKKTFLKKSSDFFKTTFSNVFKKDGGVDVDFQEKLEEALIKLDFGPYLSERVSKSVAKYKNSSNYLECVKKELMSIYGSSDEFIDIDKSRTNVVIVVGSNGSGKTTSIAKLAYRYKVQGYKVLIVAADTFRAGAVEQLQNWAQKLSIDIVVSEKNKEDPASLIYVALEKNKNQQYDLIICDTSGKQHNNKNLLQELNKICRVVKKVDSSYPHETFLVLDSTIGQSSFLQAKSFLESAQVTGIILSKMDSMSRGGIIFAIKEKLKIPVKFLGVGESIDDLIEFNLESIIDSWTKDLN